MDVDLIHAAKIAALEAEVNSLKTQLTSMDHKLDDLLALKHKGAGAFWSASVIFGISITAFVEAVKGWVFG
jgi:hypothetical protein